MALEEIRAEIDRIDPEIRRLLMNRMDCSEKIAEAKAVSENPAVYQPDREKEILGRLGSDVPADRKREYLAVVKKIIAASRMYQYSLLYDRLPGEREKLFAVIPENQTTREIDVRFTITNETGALAAILGVIGDAGYNVLRLEMIREPARRKSGAGDDAARKEGMVFLTIQGDWQEKELRALIFQLSKECRNFEIGAVR